MIFSVTAPRSTSRKTSTTAALAAKNMAYDLPRHSDAMDPKLYQQQLVLWLQRPDGWQAAVAELLADTEPPAGDSNDVRAERRRREAAETGAAQPQREASATQAGGHRPARGHHHGDVAPR